MAAEAAVSLAVKTLGHLLIKKVVFLKGVEGDVEWVRDELKRMQCFLKDAANKQSNSDRICNWISEIREVAHDAEDAIEKFVLNVESRGTAAAICLLSVASIIGMGGIGKSTLAKKIYNHRKITKRFECRAWVVVSSEFTTEDVTKQILEQLGIPVNHLLESVDDELRRQQRLQEKLYRFLTGK